MLEVAAITEPVEPRFFEDVLSEMLIFESPKRGQETLPGHHFREKNRSGEPLKTFIKFDWHWQRP